MTYRLPNPLQVALIGYGAIGSAVCDLLDSDPTLSIQQVVVRNPSLYADNRAAAGSATRTFADRVQYHLRPDVVVECAGHAAIRQHVLAALQAGIPCIVASVGALSAPGMVEQLERAAQAGKTWVQLVSGAVGGMDALAAARSGGLDKVRYEGRKPPVAWKGTVAESVVDLDNIHIATCIFSGTAREAAQRFPKNANVAATVALAGVGLDRTEVVLYADPDIAENQHAIAAEGTFGSMRFTVQGKPLAANPKTSALTVFSVVRALCNRTHTLVIG